MYIFFCYKFNVGWNMWSVRIIQVQGLCSVRIMQLQDWTHAVSGLYMCNIQDWTCVWYGLCNWTSALSGLQCNAMEHVKCPDYTSAGPVQSLDYTRLDMYSVRIMQMSRSDGCKFRNILVYISYVFSWNCVTHSHQGQEICWSCQIHLYINNAIDWG